jgi:hypothetical protein
MEKRRGREEDLYNVCLLYIYIVVYVLYILSLCIYVIHYLKKKNGYFLKFRLANVYKGGVPIVYPNA